VTVEFSFPPVEKPYDGMDAWPKGVGTNLVRATHGAMVGTEEFDAFGEGHFRQKTVNTDDTYFVLTNIVVEAKAGALDRNYVKVYAAAGKKSAIGKDRNGKTTVDGTPIDELGPNDLPSSPAAITPAPLEPDKEGKKYPDTYPKPTPEDGGDPVAPPAPTKDLGSYDTSNVYAAVGYTMNTNALWRWIREAYGDKIDAADWPNVRVRCSADGTKWSEEMLTFTNVVTTSFWYSVAIPNFETRVRAVAVKVVKRPITVSACDQRMTYQDESTLYPGFKSQDAWAPHLNPGETPADPESGLARGDDLVRVALGFKDTPPPYEPSPDPTNGVIVLAATKSSRFVISNAVADVTFNYDITFRAGRLFVDENVALFAVDLKWVYFRFGGTYFADLTVTCTNSTPSFKYDAGSMRFSFSDRTNAEGQVCLSLWNTNPSHAPLGDDARFACGFKEVFGGIAYRSLKLADPVSGASRGGWDTERTRHYGPAKAADVTPTTGNETPEMRVLASVNPLPGHEAGAGGFAPEDNAFVGWLVWTSDAGARTNAIPVLAGRTVLSGGKVFEDGPVSAEELNNYVAFGEPDVKKVSLLSTSFAAENGIGRVRVAVRNGARNTLQAPGQRAEVSVSGAESLGAPFENLGILQTDENGEAEFELGEKKFFRFSARAIETVQ